MGESGRTIAAQPQDVYNHFARTAADQQVAFVLAFDGRVDEAALRAALGRLIAAQPVLGSRFEVRGRRAFFVPVPDAEARAFSVLNAPDEWAAALVIVARTLDPVAGPLLALDLVHGPVGDALVLRVDHVTADGQGAKQALYLLATATAGELGALPGDRSWRRLRRAFSLPRRLGALRSRQAPRPTWGMPVRGEATGTRTVAVATLDAERTTSARAGGRERSATVNDLALTAFYRALFEALDAPSDRPMAVNVSFDMRRYLDADDPMPPLTNLSSIETALVQRVPGEDFASTLGRVATETVRLKQGAPGLGSAVLMEYACRLMGATRFGRMVTEPMARGRQYGVSFPFVSNFGVLEPERLSFAGSVPTRAIVVGPAGHPPFVMMGVSSYAGALSLVTGWVDGEADAEMTASLPERAIADLGAFAEAQRP